MDIAALVIAIVALLGAIGANARVEKIETLNGKRA